MPWEPSSRRPTATRSPLRTLRNSTTARPSSRTTGHAVHAAVPGQLPAAIDAEVLGEHSGGVVVIGHHPVSGGGDQGHVGSWSRPRAAKSGWRYSGSTKLIRNLQNKKTPRGPEGKNLSPVPRKICASHTKRLRPFAKPQPFRENLFYYIHFPQKSQFFFVKSLVFPALPGRVSGGEPAVREMTKRKTRLRRVFLQKPPMRCMTLLHEPSPQNRPIVWKEDGIGKRE